MDEAKRKLKVLIVDDQESFRSVLKIKLESTGNYSVLTASEGNQAILEAKKEKPDVILLDIMMPGVSGADVASNLQDFPSTEHIPIIFMTGLVQSDEVRQAERMGGRLFLAKPFTFDALTAKIKQALSDKTSKPGTDD